MPGQRPRAAAAPPRKSNGGSWAWPAPVYEPRVAIAHHACFNVANGFGDPDRDVGKQMADLYGWGTSKKRTSDRIGECPSAALIKGADFAHVKIICIVETSSHLSD